MRRRILCLNLNLFFLASVVSAQTPAVKVCVTQDNDDGYDALRPAQEIASRKLADGTRVGVVAVTPGAPSPDWQRLLTDPQSPIRWVNVAGKKAKERDQEI